jgi:hypothetical protein
MGCGRAGWIRPVSALLFRVDALARRQQRTLNVVAKLPWARDPGLHEAGCGNTGPMVDDAARDRAIYHALKAADEVAAALQAHLVEEHSADLDRTAVTNPSTDSLKLLRQARERLGEGLRAVEADRIAESDQISLATPDPRPTAVPTYVGRAGHIMRRSGRPSSSPGSGRYPPIAGTRAYTWCWPVLHSDRFI